MRPTPEAPPPTTPWDLRPRSAGATASRPAGSARRRHPDATRWTPSAARLAPARDAAAARDASRASWRAPRWCRSNSARVVVVRAAFLQELFAFSGVLAGHGFEVFFESGDDPGGAAY